MKAIQAVYLIAAGLLLQCGSAFAQRGLGAVTMQEGSPLPTLKSSKMIAIDKDDRETTFEVVPYGDGKGDSPRGRNNERLPGLLVKYVLPNGLPIPLESPTNAQKTALQDARPQGLPDQFAAKIVILQVKESGDPRGNSWVVGTGYFSNVVAPMSGEMQSTTGLPYTELDITALKDSGAALAFYGRKWRPKGGGESLIIITWDRVIGVNVLVEGKP